MMMRRRKLTLVALLGILPPCLMLFDLLWLHSSIFPLVVGKNRSYQAEKGNVHDSIAIFLNAYIPEMDPTTAIRIVEEQIDQIVKSHLGRQQHHNVTIHIVSIGNRNGTHDICKNATSIHCVHDGHVDQGGETDTLSKLYEYCASDPSKHTKAIYIHNKGSFHPSQANTLWRRAMLAAVTDPSCVHPPTDGCNACGLLFAHPPKMFTLLFPGNFFVASCDYVNKLLPPRDFSEQMKSLLDLQRRSTRLLCKLKDRRLWNIGTGRYAPEHWIGSHPHIVPCDVSKHSRDYWYWQEEHNETEFGWSMIPRADFNMTAQWQEGDDAVRYNPDVRLRDYFLLPGLLFRWIHLYNMTPPEDSWIWSTFPDALFWKAALKKYGHEAVDVVTAQDFDRNGSIVVK